uniref:Serine/threonine-protein kinase RIO2 n=1 Tax=Globodera rostochiensis TaxID=31243 RepID=A0A914GRI1_GLORO
MGKFNVQAMRFLDAQHFRILTAIEMGMKNHELVPLPLISSISAIHRGATARTLNDLTRIASVVYERGKKYDGYRLTTLGYDFLALRALCARGIVGSVGNQIGVGKESDIYVGGDPEMNDVVLKLHRLGRTSFRKLKEKRDYHRRRHFCSWLYLSRLAAAKEFAFLRALHAHKFPVPKPIDCCRHTLVMALVSAPTLCHITELRDPAALYDKLMELIVRLGSYGLIHGDLNEFNIMLNQDESPILIDFPQMVSMDHLNAKFYFDRDVQCVRTFFQRKFKFEANKWPIFGDVIRRYNLDKELEASGFTRKMLLDLNKAYDEGNFDAHLDGDDDSTVEDEDERKEQFDEEERDAFEQEGERRNGQLQRSDRFQKWLADARDELESLDIRESQLSGEQLEKMFGTLEEQTKTFGTDEEEEKEVLESPNDPPNNELPISGEEIKSAERIDDQNKKSKKGIPQVTAFGSCSVVSGGSAVISAEEVRRRLMLEKRKVRKEKLKVKGQQNAVRRGRQQNQALIREYAGWDEY